MFMKIQIDLEFLHNIESKLHNQLSSIVSQQGITIAVISQILQQDVFP